MNLQIIYKLHREPFHTKRSRISKRFHLENNHERRQCKEKNAIKKKRNRKATYVCKVWCSATKKNGFRKAQLKRCYVSICIHNTIVEQTSS